jgi:hypothetical protein
VAVALRRRRDAGGAVMRERRECIEAGPHVERPAGVIEQAEVDRDTA